MWTAAYLGCRPIHAAAASKTNVQNSRQATLPNTLAADVDCSLPWLLAYSCSSSTQDQRSYQHTS